MKKYHLYIYIVALGMIVGATSCDNYLKETSEDLLIPQKVEESHSLLVGDGYPNSFTNDVMWMDLLTDDVEVSASANANSTQAEADDNVFLPVGKGAFTWAQDIEFYDANYAKPYQNRYKNIMACNTIIENEGSMIGDSASIYSCIAQAYALRAMNYFYLVNWYGTPYNKTTADKDMGVILRLKSEMVRDTPKRASVAAVYQQINSDLEQAQQLFDKAKKTNNLYLMNQKAVSLLRCRVALFMENWDDVITYGAKLADDDFNLYDLSSLSKEELVRKKFSFISSKNPEAVFLFGGRIVTTNDYMDNLKLITGAGYAPSQTRKDDLINSYAVGDNRIYAFFCQNDTEYDDSKKKYTVYEDYRHLPYKHNSFESYSQALRTSEALLNMAEAYVHKGNSAEAINLLNLLRKKRFTSDTYQPLTIEEFSSKDGLLQAVRLERRRELCFEETHRWTDLRRYGMPQIEHIFYAAKNATPETYILKSGDKNYTLELPYSELNYNSAVERTNRRVIQAQ